MVVGVLSIEFHIPSAHSLKEKRGELKRAIARIKAAYNVSVAEVGKNELWQSAELGITLVGNEGGFVNSCLDQVLKFVEGLRIGEIVNHRMEIVHF
jgi:hypothetical protein